MPVLKWVYVKLRGTSEPLPLVEIPEFRKMRDN
jgi:hypothetical protein